MIKVGFGVTQLARGMGGAGIDGIGHYTHELLNALSGNHDVDLFPFSFGYYIQQPLCNKHVTILGRFDVEVVKGVLLPALRMNSIRGQKVDLIHATDHLVPYVKDVPLVATLMDAIPLSNPECMSSKYPLITKAKIALWKKISRRADRVITISEYSKTEISRWFDIHPNQISVIPLAVDVRFFTVIAVDERKKIRQSLNVPENYFLSVGTLQPRKNIGRVLAAMRMLSDDIKKTNPLVIVGRIGWGVENLLPEIDQAVKEGWCIRLNRITDVELRALLQSAKGLVFPSLAEGFGLPVLEAFASRTPVITSNTTSLPEASNGAALLVDPTSVDEISAAMQRVLTDDIFIQECIDKGYKHAQQMTWQKCAKDTVSVYHELIKK
jgi:glycosyltransferase involved in cell wall biosynthesis